MSDDIKESTLTLSTAALRLGDRATGEDSLKVLLSTLVALINERPGHSAAEYLNTLTLSAESMGLVRR